ncbi:MAG: GldG family protein [Defluviitaleaceae bacterium]|nr:GldG family protein [Defluviitaleaceae bacterium]
MIRILNKFKNRKIASRLACLIIILILAATNIVLTPFNLSFDLTPERRYTLSDQTIEIIQSLDQEVTIYALFSENMFHSSHYDTINELLARYNRIAPKISLEYRDPAIFPQIIERFRSDSRLPEGGGIVVESGGRFHVISPAELIVVDHMFDGETFIPFISEITVEPQITNAILFVTGDNAPVIYHIVGHNETPVPTSLTERIEASNYEFRQLDLLMIGEIPSDTDLLFITTPGRDFAPLEKELIIEYIKNGGRIFAAVQGAFAKWQIFDEIFEAMGISFDNSLIVEQGANNHYPGMSPVTIIPGHPEFSTNEIVQHMISRNALTVMPNSTGITALETDDYIWIEPLLITSDDAYGITDLNAQIIDFVDGYLEGPFNVAVAITNFDTGFRAIVIGTDTILDEVLNAAIVGGNYEFILSAINWTQDRENNLFILPRNAPDIYVFMNQTTQAVLVFVCLLIIPAVIFGTAASFVIRRRKISELQDD